MHNGFEDLDLDRLRRRRSEKWRLHPPDVLPAFIAEMDYDLAEPVLAALRAAVDLSDCGYAALADIGETFAPFATARHGWASGSPSAPAARCWPPSWTGCRLPRVSRPGRSSRPGGR
jgi:bifunctional pyridoxal-dependent enzyme with beta-cystathionase and maltose regulon repressor activities